MGLNLATMEKITADVQMNDLQWVEVGEGSYFKVLTVHEPTNTVAFGYKMDPGAPDFPSHFHICRAMAWTVKGWYGYRESKNPEESRITTGMFSYEAAGSFHTPLVIVLKAFKPWVFSRGIPRCCSRTTLSQTLLRSESETCWSVISLAGPVLRRILCTGMVRLRVTQLSSTISHRA